jgi:chromosome segregation ATPase
MVTYTLPSSRPRPPSSKWQLLRDPRSVPLRGGKAVARLLALEADAAARSSPRRRLAPPLAALAAVIIGMGMLLWKLHEERNEVARLERHVTNLTTLSRAILQDLKHTRSRLMDATRDKLVLGRFLGVAEHTQKELKLDLDDLQARHREVVISGEQLAEEGASLKQALESETAQREEAQQLAANHEADSQRLANLATQLEQGVAQLRHDNVLMWQEIGRQRCHIGSLESQNSSLRSENSSLQSEVSSLNSTISSLQNQVCNHSHNHCDQGHCRR